MTKICQKCNQQFECLANNVEQCQCSSLHISTELLNYISKHYNNCLCVNCLTSLTNAIVDKQSNKDDK